MHHYRRDTDGWVDYFSMPEPSKNLFNRPPILVGVRVTEMQHGSFHIDSIYQTSDGKYYMEDCEDISPETFADAYKRALEYFDGVIKKNQSGAVP